MTEENIEQSLPQPPQPNKVEFVVPDPEDELFTTYANNVQIGLTNFDLRMLFGEVVDSQPEKVIIEQRAQITVSYLQAKLLSFMLSQAVALHEAKFGVIKIPPEMGTFNVTNTEAAMPAGGGSIRR